jgi:hypothetical protein
MPTGPKSAGRNRLVSELQKGNDTLSYGVVVALQVLDNGAVRVSFDSNAVLSFLATDRLWLRQ